MGEVGRTAIGIHGIRYPEIIFHSICGRIVLIDHIAAHIVDIAPIERQVLPVARPGIYCPRCQPRTVERVRIFLNPLRIIKRLRMVGSQVIHTTSFSLVIGPLCVKPFCGRAVIGDSIKLDCFLLTVFGTFQFIPFVIRFSITVCIFGYEYNSRFGDPETQVVLPLLESDLLHIMQACTDGTLDGQEVKFSDGAAACVILASGGYPVAYEKGKPISGLVDGQLPGEENVTVYHSGTAITEDGQLVTNGGRVLGVTATGPRLTNALSHAYEAAEKISFEKLHKRSDIGLRALKALAEKQ